MICRNCQTSFQGNFCSHCGQTAKVRRFNFKYFLSESFFSSLDLEKGWWSTILVMFRCPGKAVREYLHGKRISLYVPAKFLFLIGALVTALMLRHNPFSVVHQDEENVQEQASLYFSPNLVSWYEQHFEGFWIFTNEYITLINVISIPIFSLCTYVIFMYKKYNYTENLIMNIYIICMQLLALVPFMLLLEISAVLNYKGALMGIYTALTFAYNIWAYVTFFKETNFSGGFLAVVATAMGYAGNIVASHIFYFLFKSMGVEFV